MSNRCADCADCIRIADLCGDVLIGGYRACWDVEQCFPNFDLEIRAAQVKAEALIRLIESRISFQASGKMRATSGAVDL